MIPIKEIKKMPKWAQKQIMDQLNEQERNSNSIPGSMRNVEQDSDARIAGQNATEEDNSRTGSTDKPALLKRATLIVTHYRRRLADIDGLSIKAILDSTVASGILYDDGPKYLLDVSHKQVKVGSKSPEFTVFRFIEA